MEAVTRDSIAIADLIASVSGVEQGGVVLFLGTVRRGAEDGPVRGIEYSAYEEMATAEFARIIDEARERWPDAQCAAQHRLGHVPVGEPSIAVAAAAPHRAGAFAACRYVIEEAKKRLPVWKKEWFDDGTTSWREHEDPGSPRRHPSSRSSTQDE
jgi:molybdopterin synthase catalytic subunit